MSFLRPTNGFDRLSDAVLSQSSSFIIDKLSTSPVYVDPDPSLATLQAALNEFDKATSAALTRDSDKINSKNEKRNALIELLHLESYYVLYKSKGNRVIAESSGFRFAKDPSPRAAIGKPTNLIVVNSNQTGAMDVSVDAMKGAKTYIYQYTSDPEQKIWNSINCTQRKCRITGLTPGVLYYWRVSIVGTKEQITCSDVVGRVAA